MLIKIDLQKANLNKLQKVITILAISYGHRKIKESIWNHSGDFGGRRIKSRYVKEDGNNGREMLMHGEGRRG